VKRFLHCGAKPFAGDLTVHRLRARILDRHLVSPPPQADGGRDFINVLAARAAAARETFLQLGVEHAQPRHARGKTVFR